MPLTAGIVGLPNVGKSTLFNAITKSQVEAANYPFATIQPNVGVVEVPDYRIDRLVEIFNPKKTIYTTFEFTDIAGLVKGASQGEGLGNQFLSNIRLTDAICHVVRCFDNPDITHVENSVDPIRDIEIINLELTLADLQTIENRRSKIERKAKTNKDKESLDECAYYNQVKEYAQSQNNQVVALCAQMEEELSGLDKEEKDAFLEELGVETSGLDQLIQKAYAVLDLCTFLTAGEDECRAWTFKKGMKAPDCAGVIHTDFKKGFIRAEVYRFEDIDELGSELAIKEAGRLRLEGKDYVVQDGDVMHFRFNV